MKLILILTHFIFAATALYSQSYLGQNVPDVTETDCNNNTERIYDVLATGKPILIFKTDMICSNTIGFGTTVRQYADLYQAQYRTWVCADFMDASNYSEQCTFMQQYQQQTGLNANSAFCFIDTTSVGAYDPAMRSSIPKCFQGYVVIGLDSTIIYVGGDVNLAVNAALNESQSLDIDENKMVKGVSIYPNPSSDWLFVDTSIDLEEINITNATGQIVEYTGNLINPIDISSFEQGFYMVRLKLKNGRFVNERLRKM
jgi:hypothetical protein